MSGKIGFCCKWVSATGDSNEEALMNQSTTTITALSKLSYNKRVDKISGLLANNMDTLERLVQHVGELPEGRRLLRLTSDLLPCYTHEVATDVYLEPSIRELIETGFHTVGHLARSKGIRLTFHPGQYTVLNSVNEGTRVRAMAEFEYHIEMMRMMGFTGGWHPHGAAVNVHVGSRDGGTRNFIKTVKGLSDDARNLITVENDEISFGLSSLENVAEYVPVVFDIHHEWVHGQGSYVTPDDPRIEFVIDSWRGVQPLGHYSVSHETIMPHHDPNILPDFAALRAKGCSVRDIRAHSNMCWNVAANEWAISHLSWMDIEVEAKQKNLASEQLFNQLHSPTP